MEITQNGGKSLNRPFGN